MTEDPTLPSPPTPPADPPRSAEPTPPPPYRPNYWFLAIVSILSLGLDLGTKVWAKARLEDAKSFFDRHVELFRFHVGAKDIGGAVTFARNKGGAWGLLQDQPEVVRRPFFLVISVLAIVFIVSLYRRLTPQQTALKWGLPLVLGGALGNLVNRIQYNYVVDFIDMFYVSDGKEHHWPTYNVADVAICIGVGLMAIDMFTSRKAPKNDAAKPDEKRPERDVTLKSE
jgi:signal peptidase II